MQRLASLCLFVAMLAISCGQSWTIDAPSCVAPGGSFDVVLRADSGASEQGAAQWRLFWDPGAFTLDPGFGMAGLQLAPGWDGAANTSVAGEIWVAVYHVGLPGPTGMADQGTLRLQHTGGAGFRTITGTVEVWSTPTFTLIGSPPFAMTLDGVQIDCAAGPCPVAPGTCGDCNGDTVLSILDALTASQIAVGLVLPTPPQFSRCNVAGVLEPSPAAAVNVLDALALAQQSAGLMTTLACC